LPEEITTFSSEGSLWCLKQTDLPASLKKHPEKKSSETVEFEARSRVFFSNLPKNYGG